MPLLNPNFAEAGALPGEAAHWTLSTRTRRERIAGFGMPPHAFEGFDWSEHATTLTDAIVAVFESEAVEDFHEGWALAPYLFEMSSAQLVAAELEGFESGSVVSDWAEIEAVPALFEGELSERFHRALFYTDWDPLDSDPADFTGSGSREDFEATWSATTTL